MEVYSPFLAFMNVRIVVQEMISLSIISNEGGCWHAPEVFCYCSEEMELWEGVLQEAIGDYVARLNDRQEFASGLHGQIDRPDDEGQKGLYC